jgi:hypothetical protein
MRMHQERLCISILALLIVGAPGCGDERGEREPPDAGLPDSGSVDPGGYDPICECFGYHECRDGVVTTWVTTQVECDGWNGECPMGEGYQCERGCRADAEEVDYAALPPEELCEENRPKQIGDACATEEDCRPEVAVVQDDFTVVNVYLTCDTAAGLCVAREAPVVADWMAQCGLLLDGEPGFAYGYVESDACSGGVCLFVERETCVSQGCTIRCVSDGECPMGSVCQSGWGVCKPGPQNGIGEDLTCPG